MLFRSGDQPADPAKIAPQKPSRLRHSVEMSCDIYETLIEEFRDDVEQAYHALVQDRALWDASANIVEVIPMAGRIKHKFDRAAYTFLRIDGDVVMRIDKEDIATLHVPWPSLVQKVILEQVRWMMQCRTIMMADDCVVVVDCTNRMALGSFRLG